MYIYIVSVIFNHIILYLIYIQYVCLCVYIYYIYTIYIILHILGGSKIEQKSSPFASPFDPSSERIPDANCSVSWNLSKAGGDVHITSIHTNPTISMEKIHDNSEKSG